MENEVIHELYSYDAYFGGQMSQADVGETRVFHLIWGNNVKVYVTDVRYGMHFIGSMASYYEHGNEHVGT
jgi:hypothetical protein